MRLLITLLLLAPWPAAAQTALCRIQVRSLDFGIYRSLDTAPHTVIGDVNVICPPAGGRALRVSVSTGSSGQYTQRTMLSGTSVLRYNLYADPARRIVLGDGTAGSIVFPAPLSRALGRARWPMFGAIDPGQQVPAGLYTDSLLIQVAF